MKFKINRSPWFDVSLLVIPFLAPLLLWMLYHYVIVPTFPAVDLPAIGYWQWFAIRLFACNLLPVGGGRLPWGSWIEIKEVKP